MDSQVTEQKPPSIISIVATSWLTIGLINSLSKGIGGQLNLYENMGY